MPNIRQLSTDSNGNPILIYPQELGPTIAEPLDGPLTVDDVFDRFPETVYNQNRDTHLYKLLTALCGDAGAGILKKQSFMGRLKNEGNLLTFTDLDTLYSHTLKFPRLPDEQYNDLDPTSDILTPLDWDRIHLADEKYNGRVRQFLQAIRLGNTPAGMALAAEAGTGVHCDVWENYRAYYDLLTDDPLGIEFQGQTNNPGEFVISPRVSDGDPTTYTTTDNPLTQEPIFSGSKYTVGHVYAVGDIVYPSSLALRGHVYQVTTAGTAGAEPSWTPAYTQLDALTWVNSDATDPNAETLTDTRVADTQISGAHFSELGASADDYNYTFDVDTFLLPVYQRNMLAVLDLLRPWGTLVTIQPFEAHFRPITEDDGLTPIDIQTDASSTRFKMTRFVTGAQTVDWPITDDVTQDRSNGYFIQSGIEKEASHLPWSQKERPTIYHTLEGVHAYRNEALDDPTYDTASFYAPDTNYKRFRSEHIGPFETTFAQLFPYFQTIPQDDLLEAVKAISRQNSPLIFEGRSK